MHSGEIDCLAGRSEHSQLMLEPVKSLFYWGYEAFLMGVASMNCAGPLHLHAEGGFYFIVIWIPSRILSLYSCRIWEGQQEPIHLHHLQTHWLSDSSPECLSLSLTPVCSSRPDGVVHIYWNHSADTDTLINDAHKGLLLIVMSLCSTAVISQSKANGSQEEWPCVRDRERKKLFFCYWFQPQTPTDCFSIRSLERKWLNPAEIGGRESI